MSSRRFLIACIIALVILAAGLIWGIANCGCN